MHLPDRLKAYRWVRGLSQRHPAVMLGVDESTVWHWEQEGARRGRATPARIEELLGGECCESSVVMDLHDHRQPTVGLLLQVGRRTRDFSGPGLCHRPIGADGFVLYRPCFFNSRATSSMSDARSRIMEDNTAASYPPLSTSVARSSALDAM